MPARAKKKSSGHAAKGSRKRQSRLSFAPQPASSSSSSRPAPTTPAASDKATAKAAQSSSSVKSTPGRTCTHFEVVILTPSKTSVGNSLRVATAPPASAQRKRASSPIEIEGSGDDDIGSAVPPSGKRLKSRRLLSDSDPDERVQELKKAASPLRGVANNPTATKRKIQPAEGACDDNEEDYDDDDIITPGKRRRNSLSAAIFSSQVQQDDDTPRPSSVRRLKPKLAISDLDESDEDDAPVKSGRRKSSQQPKPAQRLLFGRVNGADLDSDSDLEILPPPNAADGDRAREGYDDGGDLDDDLKLAQKTPIVKTRTRYAGSTPKLTPFQRKLAALKAKREGRSLPTESDVESTQGRALYDTDTETNGTVDDDEESSGSIDGSEDSDNSVMRFYSEDQDAYDSAFVVEDDPEALLGVPDAPLHLTAASHQSPSTSFKIYSHWLLLALLCPDFSTSAEPELVALSRKNLERRVETYGTSVLTSSVWTLPFSRAFKARPEFCQTPTTVEHMHCDACNRPRRAGTWVWFSGPRYNPDTLEELDESDIDSQDSVGGEIPDEDTRFALGRHCLTRAEMAHAFFHWKWQLKDVLKGELVNRGYIDEGTGELMGKWRQKTAEMRNKKKEEWAMRVAKGLDAELETLYEQFANSLVDAEKNMNAQSSGKWRFNGLVRRV